MKREIKRNPAVLRSVKTNSIGDVRVWLQNQAVTHNLKWLLAHADDGVIWGEHRNEQLVTSDRAVPEVSPPLRAETLQQARLFATHAELLLWRDGDNCWHARLIRDAAEEEDAAFIDAIDEPQLLWGTDPQPLANGFTLMSDGAQGLRHAIPLDVRGKFDESSRPLRLWVRHYVQDDESGFSRIVASRLFDLKLEEVK
jgi:CRISPR-associated protein (TIGR03984 family)